MGICCLFHEENVNGGKSIGGDKNSNKPGRKNLEDGASAGNL